MAVLIAWILLACTLVGFSIAPKKKNSIDNLSGVVVMMTCFIVLAFKA